MENSNNNGGSTGVGFCVLLTLIFVTLKLTEVIDWSWKWILSPIWIPILIALICSTILYLFFKN